MVIIGGGVVGCSIAYHLARRGPRDVVVLERETVGSGTTSERDLSEPGDRSRDVGPPGLSRRAPGS